MVIGLERNQQDEEVKNETTIRILKNRFSGETGVACTLEYNNNTGRLHEQNTYFESNSDGNMVDPNLLPVEPVSQFTPHGGTNGLF